MADDSDDEREEELASIAAIFPELTIADNVPFSATLDLPVAPSEPLTVTFPATRDGAPPGLLPTPPSSDNDNVNVKVPRVSLPATASRGNHKLSYLPPLHLTIDLPQGYPSDKPPSFHLAATPAWLPDAALRKLEAEGSALWEEYGHGQVVFAYIDYLQQAAERAFDLVQAGNQVLEVSLDLQVELLDFDIKAKREEFERGTYECAICLEPKKGSACYRLLRCNHVFCAACLQDFYNNCIQEGDVAGVKCLDPTCGKEGGTRAARGKKAHALSPSELLQIPLEHSMVQRYVELKRKKKLEADKTTVYCPRKWCQGAARSKKYPRITDFSQMEESDDEDEPAADQDATKDDSKPKEMEDRVAICEDCQFAFCKVCNMSWHGDFIHCYPRSSAELSAEEHASLEYLRMHTSPCPTCNVPCQKTHGCNHMQCFQCRSHFCYLCSSWLNPENPYQHFNQLGKECYQRLWELEEGDNGEGQVQFVGARGWEAQVIAARERGDHNEARRIEDHQVAIDVQARANDEAEVDDRNLAAFLENGGDRPGNHDPPPEAPDAPPADLDPELEERLEAANARNPRYAQRPVGQPQQVRRPDRAGFGAQHRQMDRRAMERFVRMAENDEEDDWDSDELGDDDDFEIPEGDED